MDHAGNKIAPSFNQGFNQDFNPNAHLSTTDHILASITVDLNIDDIEKDILISQYLSVDIGESADFSFTDGIFSDVYVKIKTCGCVHIVRNSAVSINNGHISDNGAIDELQDVMSHIYYPCDFCGSPSRNVINFVAVYEVNNTDTVSIMMIDGYSKLHYKRDRLMHSIHSIVERGSPEVIMSSEPEFYNRLIRGCVFGIINYEVPCIWGFGGNSLLFSSLVTEKTMIERFNIRMCTNTINQINHTCKDVETPVEDNDSIHDSFTIEEPSPEEQPGSIEIIEPREEKNICSTM